MWTQILNAVLSLFGKKPAEPEPVAQPAPPTADAPVPAHVDSIPMPVVPPVGPKPSVPPPVQTDISTPEKFIDAIAPAAVRCMKHSGVPASVTLAQAILESAWGKSVKGMNLFGIKADSSWTGPTVSFPTHEVVNGKPIQIEAKFRAYSSWDGSVEDHAKFLTENPRYKPAFAFKDGPNFARAIAKAGYATDPAYADKLIAIMRGRDLTAFDV